jgi:hypothetical protein
MRPYYRNTDEGTRRLERAAAVGGDVYAQRRLERARERARPRLLPLAQRAAAGDEGAAELVRQHYPDLRLSETVTQDPMTGFLDARIDLRRSLWTASPESFAERAPYTLELIRQGAIEGYLEERGGRLKVVTVPGHRDAHGRYGVVFFNAHERLGFKAAAHVHFQDHIACPLMEDEGDAWEPCDQCDEDGDHMVEIHRTIHVPDDMTLEQLLEAIDSVETDLLEGPW